MKRVKVGSWYIFKPVGMDIWSPTASLQAGDKVKVVNLYGCPPANKMGHCYVDNEKGEFAGMVLCNSLSKL
jgi:hypothetical protein